MNVTTGLTYPFGPSNPAFPFIDLNSVNTSSAGGTLYVLVDAIGYTGPIASGQTGPFLFEVGGTLASGTTGSIELLAGYEAGNLFFSDGGSFYVIGSLGPF